MRIGSPRRSGGQTRTTSISPVSPFARRGTPSSARLPSSAGRFRCPTSSADRDYSFSEGQRLGSYRTLLGVPMMSDGVPTGVIILWRKDVDVFEEAQIELVATFAAQASIAIASAELFQAINDKNRELEIASRHKSEFLASMSHELRTPLNAVIGFSEVLLDRMFGEINVKQEEYLRDILGSGRHLLELINDVLDVSKVEAGRMELEIARLRSAAACWRKRSTLVREQAGGTGPDAHARRRSGSSGCAGRRAPDQAGRHEPRDERGEVHAARRSDRRCRHASSTTRCMSVSPTMESVSPPPIRRRSSTRSSRSRTVRAEARGDGLGLTLSRADRRASRRTHVGGERSWRGEFVHVLAPSRTAQWNPISAGAATCPGGARHLV